MSKTSFPLLLFLLLLCNVFAMVAALETDTDERVCVTLLHYGNVQCHGNVKSTKQITAWTKKGSPCRHTAQMQDNSVRDQYCSLPQDEHNDEDDEGCVFYQTVFVHNKHCHVSLAQKPFSPQHLSYKRGKCTYGYKLKSCVPGPCPESPDTSVDEMIRELR